MVERQLRARGIENERVLDAMGVVPRELFVPTELLAVRTTTQRCRSATGRRSRSRTWSR
jgi:protein-L-isoaspartate O-methyltransferase